MAFKKGISGNPNGRPKGSGVKVDRSLLVSLLDELVNDLSTNYDKLTTNQKIRLLISFNHLYKEPQNETATEPRVFQILNGIDLKEHFSND